MTMIYKNSGYEKKKNLFYHLIIWIGWIMFFSPNEESGETTHENDGVISHRVNGIQEILHKEEILSLIIKVRGWWH